MLIVAIPKSASTSLASTLARINGVSFKQKNKLQKKKNHKKCKSNNLHKIHSDMIDFEENEIKSLAKSNTIYKQHIFPSENNLKFIKTIKCVIILRNVEDIIRSYKRKFDYDGQHKMGMFGLTRYDSYEKYLDQFKQLGIYDDLVYFNSKYKGIQDDNHLIIYKDDIINKTNETINKINLFFGMPHVSSNILLSKERYVPPE